MTDERNPADLAETLNEAQRLEDELFDKMANHASINERNQAHGEYEAKIIEALALLTEEERADIFDRFKPR